ncbi:MAG: hypothetical protein ACOC56_05015, partial [Atribacterota bacterium]
DYALQKIMKARQGFSTWKKVTNRDLACYLSFVSSCYLTEKLDIHGRLATRGSQVISIILNEQGLDKANWTTVAYEIVQAYDKYFSNSKYKGLTWSFLENKYYRTELFKILENKNVSYNTGTITSLNKTKKEKLKFYKNELDLNDELAEIQYYIIKGYTFNKPPDEYDLKNWNNQCRELLKQGGMIEDITLTDKEKEKELLGG